MCSLAYLRPRPRFTRHKAEGDYIEVVSLYSNRQDDLDCDAFERSATHVREPERKCEDSEPMIGTIDAEGNSEGLLGHEDNVPETDLQSRSFISATFASDPSTNPN